MNLQSQKLTVNFLDGTVKEVVATQWSMGQWAVFCSRQGIKFDLEDPGLLMLVMLRYQAWAEIHRVKGAGTVVPSFDVWDMTVDEVTTVESVDVFPTGTELSEG